MWAAETMQLSPVFGYTSSPYKVQWPRHHGGRWLALSQCSALQACAPQRHTEIQHKDSHSLTKLFEHSKACHTRSFGGLQTNVSIKFRLQLKMYMSPLIDLSHVSSSNSLTSPDSVGNYSYHHFINSSLNCCQIVDNLIIVHKQKQKENPD